MGTRGLISSPSLAAQRAQPSDISPQKGGDSGSSVKSCLAHRSKEQRKGARVTFQNGEHPEELASNSSHKLRPLLGYDWIAGVLDVEKSLQGRSDDFYEELQDFRMQNESECVHKYQAKFSPEKQSVLSLFADTDDPIADADSHQCTFLYKLNSRLFPVPVHPGECCPVCRKPKSSHPHTTKKPALVRVSIPSSTLLPSYDYKAHRRSSFDSTDSLGLPSCVDDSSRVLWPDHQSLTNEPHFQAWLQRGTPVTLLDILPVAPRIIGTQNTSATHCLLGWSNTFRSYLQPPSNLDLRSHLEKRTEQEDQVTTSLKFDQAPVLTPLARHHFQHFTPKRKKRRPRPSTNS